MQIHAPTALALFRPAFHLLGDGSVSATFIIAGAVPTRYGLTLGGAHGLAFLVRPDGTAGIGVLRSGAVTNATWATTAMQLPAVGTPLQVEVRVHGMVAGIAVNGVVQTTTTIAPSALDGVPGVYTEGGDVVVAGFTVKTARVVPPAGGGQ